jgi:type I restriction enzyme M protein
LNLYLHRLEKANIEFHNPLTTPGPKSGGQYPGTMYDVILANPPFAGKVQDESILEDLNAGLNTRATELLFLKWFLDHLAPGGRAGVIVPNGVLFGSTKAAKKVRELLLSQFDLQAVVSLPSGVFKPYSGVGTAALIFERPTQKSKEGFVTKSVWFYDLTADGYSLDDKRTPIEANDIPDVLAKWPKREEATNSYRVPLELIIEGDLNLASGKYRTASMNAIKHDDPAHILDEILRIEKQISNVSNRLRRKILK